MVGRLIIAGVVVFLVVIGAVLVGLSAYPWRKTASVKGASLLIPDMLMLSVNTCKMQREASVEETEAEVQVMVVASLSPFRSGGLSYHDPVFGTASGTMATELWLRNTRGGRSG